MKLTLSDWTPWSNRKQIPGFSYPGIYVIADEQLTGPFGWMRSIVYIGMTTNGLRGRLANFEKTWQQAEPRHGGADRVRFAYPDFEEFSQRSSLAVMAFPCNPKAHSPSDLRVRGDVVKAEWEAVACYVEQFGELPRFNQRGAPKMSRQSRA